MPVFGRTDHDPRGMLRPRRPSRRALWLLVVLRALVFSLAAQMGGVMRDGADVVWAFAAGADAPDVDDDCLLDRNACHCPPGCPNCHCSHGVASLPARVAAPSPLGVA